MKINYICSNIGSRKDGIGHYSKNIMDEIASQFKSLQIKVRSSNIPENRLGRILSFRMTAKLFQTTFNNEIVLIEYPFTEYSPFIIFPLILMSILKKRKVFISLHEYFRVNRLRKIIIDVMISLFDNFLVTDTDVRDYLFSKGKKVKIRQIPSNIIVSNKTMIKKENNRFVYFGLINTSKAINEMIEGWHLFNKSGNNELRIITSSNTRDIEETNGIKIIHNAPDDTVDRELKEARYILLPIRPMVHINNASYMAGVSRGCIPIGKFSNSINADGFIKLNDYTPNSISNALFEAVSMDNVELHKTDIKLLKLKEKMPSFEETAKVYFEMINETCC